MLTGRSRSRHAKRMATAIIYKIENTASGKVYVGATNNLKHRWKCHRHHLRAGTHHSRHLQFAWRKDGEESFSVSVIEECSAEQRVEREQYWIDHYQASARAYGYNICPRADGPTGRRHSQETRAKMRESARGKIKSETHRRRISESQRGKLVSEETREKLSRAGKGRKLSEETIKKILAKKKGYSHSEATREKMRAKAIGRTVSPETKVKIAEAGKGRKWTAEQRQKIMAAERRKRTDEERAALSQARGGRPFIVTSPDGESFEFATLSDAKASLGLDQSNVHKCLIGKAQRTKGYKCEYKAPNAVNQV